jgi:hypothetical protein
MPRTSLALAAALISSLTGCADLRNAINPNPDAPRTPTREEAARNVAYTCTHTSLRHTAYCAKYDASPEGLAFAAKETADPTPGATAASAATPAPLSSLAGARAAEARREAEAKQQLEEEVARMVARAATPEGAARDAAINAEGAVRDAAYHADQQKADALVRGYKFCMVAADSTYEARKLNAYERTLYLEYLQRADARCRQKNRCDWAERITQTDPQLDTGCYYDSPGLQ